MNDEPIIRSNFSGLPAIRATRLTVYSIMDHYLDGAGLAEIADFYRKIGETCCHFSHSRSAW